MINWETLWKLELKVTPTFAIMHNIALSLQTFI